MIEATVNIGLVKEDKDEFYNVDTVNENLDKIDEEFGRKVDKVAGKGLSANDYTTAEKNKLAGIDNNANNYSLPLAASGTRGGVKIGYTANGRNYPVQLSNEKMYVNVPWTDNNTTYSAATQSAAGLMSAADKIKLNGIESGAGANVQSDWNAADSSADSYIKNKPTIPTKTSQLTNDSKFQSFAHYSATSNHSSGYYKIKIKSSLSWMLSFTVRLYQGYVATDILVSGYNYGTSHWYSPAASLISSSLTSMNIVFGYDSDYLWISVPAGNYTGLSIFGINNGYTQVSDLSSLFEITYVSSLSGTTQNTVTAYSPWMKNETVANAIKATQDGNGNIIVDTYAKKSIYGDAAISMGRKSGTDVGNHSFAFGINVEAYGGNSHAEGNQTGAYGGNSHAEGNQTGAYGEGSHAEGSQTGAYGFYSHAEGSQTAAIGPHSHTEGNNTEAGLEDDFTKIGCHAEGINTRSIGNASHSEGYWTEANNISSHVSGKFNKTMTSGGDYNNQIGDVFVIGNGTSASAKSNAIRVTYTGEIKGTKAFQSSGADYAEFIKPWADGNEEEEDRVGYFVTVRDGMLCKANEGDYIAGITSGNPSIVGNADEDYYWRYERDEFNRILMEDVPEIVMQTEKKALMQKARRKDEDGNPLYDEDGTPIFDSIPVLDEDGNQMYEEVPLFDEETHEPIMVETGNIIKNARMKLAEGYDPSLQESYIERKNRKEWDYVGMLGVLPVRDDGTCMPGQFCKCGNNGIATLAEERGFDTYMVIGRIAEHVVNVILK